MKYADRNISLGFVVGLLFCPQWALGAIITVTYSGVVKSGFDVVGIFGVPNAALSGLPFEAVYVINTMNGFHDYGPGNFDLVYGGDSVNYGHPISATLSIGSVIDVVDGKYYGGAGAFSGGEGVVAYSKNDYRFEYPYKFVSLGASYPRLPIITQNIGPVTAHITGSFEFQYFINGVGTFEAANADFDGLGVSSSVLSVPEVSSWILMLTGFGVSGGALRAKRNRSVGLRRGLH